MDQLGTTTVESKVIETRRGGEALVFEIPLGILNIVCIANIPDDGEDKAPVYLRFTKGDLLKAKVPRVRRSQPVPRQIEIVRVKKRTA